MILTGAELIFMFNSMFALPRTGYLLPTATKTTLTKTNLLALGRYRTLANSYFAQPNTSKLATMPRYPLGKGDAIFTGLSQYGYSQAKVKQFQQQCSLGVIKKACEGLLSMDSMKVDEICITFGTHYLPSHKLNSLTAQTTIISLIQEQIRQEKDYPDAAEIFHSIKDIYEQLNGVKIGFLRGDLHYRTFFELNRLLDSKLKAQIEGTTSKQVYLEKEDWEKLFNSCTNPVNFRLPEKGIYARNLESRANLYQRQLVLEEVSSEQSFQKTDQIVQTLMNLNKVQEAEVVRRFIVDWLVPLTKALSEEQWKCRQPDLKGPRKIYGSYLLELSPEQLATVALTQLIVETFASIYRQGSVDRAELPHYEGIQQRFYISRVMNRVESQLAYERESRLFRNTQRQYDVLINKLKQERGRNPSEKDEGAEPENMDMEKNEAESSEAATDKDNKGLHYQSQAFQQKLKELPYKYVPPLLRKEFLKNMASRITRLRRKEEIPNKVKREMGDLLVTLLRQLLRVKNKYGYSVPLLYLEHKFVQNKKDNKFQAHSTLRINEEFLGTLMPKISKTEDMFMHMERSVPTLISPLPWVEPGIGGYYSQATSVMRYSNCPVQERVIKYADNHRVFGILDFLGSTPWKINKQVLNVVEQVWVDGGMQSCIPKRYSDHINPVLTSYKLQKNAQKKKELARQIQALRDEHSLRSDFLLKLNIARSFSNLDYFYFPHNLDFRGRVYPIPPHLNHIGNDLCRGLLLFGKGRPLGKGGLRWLKIHTANLMGLDKKPINEKVQYVDANIQRILSIARDPLRNKEWLQYEDCWQAIASIFDLAAALKHPNPVEYVSYLHIHQDGSCNGLQHYAALGRDIEGAYQVNLGPSQKPSDIYTHVSKMVVKMLQEDIEGGSEQAELAQKLSDNIKRKTIKQTVMTSVYGVTFIGAREQIYRQLRDQNFMSEDDTYKASLYVAKLTLKAISNLFTGAHGIKRWFRECANKVSKTGNPVGWMTPLGLPVVQPYRKESNLDLINIVGHKMQVPREIENIPVNVPKQTSAFPPNYVHSLDSSHMMYTAEVCKQQRLSFAAVHDSYWTHAGDVDRMNEILRDQFIKLHSQPLLENFRDSLQIRFPEIDFPEIPERGQFNLQKIRESLYFFS